MNEATNTATSETITNPLSDVKPTNKIYGYARVSTSQQDLEIQIEALKKFGVEEDMIFSEKLSGKSMDNRKELQRLIELLEEGDTLVVHKLDRLGRSVSQVMTLVDTMIKEKKHLIVIDANIDTRNMDGIQGIMTKALITLLGLMGEMERTFILERTKAGRERAVSNGTKLGRRKVKKQLYELAIKDYETGHYTVSQIMKKYGELTEATFYRRLKEYREKNSIIK